MQRFIALIQVCLTHAGQSGWPLDGAATMTIMPLHVTESAVKYYVSVVVGPTDHTNA